MARLTCSARGLWAASFPNANSLLSEENTRKQEKKNFRMEGGKRTTSQPTMMATYKQLSYPPAWCRTLKKPRAEMYLKEGKEKGRSLARAIRARPSRRKLAIAFAGYPCKAASEGRKGVMRHVRTIASGKGLNPVAQIEARSNFDSTEPSKKK